jgi:hypothetical protein
MRRSLIVALLALGALALLPFPVTRAHEGHDHKILGTVTRAAADAVLLEDTDGKAVTVRVTKETKVRSKPIVKVEEIKAGTRVVVTATEGPDKTLTARTIEVGAAPKTK